MLILQQDIGHLQLVANHLIEADALCPFGVDVESSLVFARQEALRHCDEKIHGRDHQGHRDGGCDEPILNATRSVTFTRRATVSNTHSNTL